MRALRDFNTPKMPNSDIPIFMRLIQVSVDGSHVVIVLCLHRFFCVVSSAFQVRHISLANESSHHQDLFPESYKTKPMKDQSLMKITRQTAKEKGLQPDGGFVGKVVEFQELLDVRHSVMLIGPAGSGKTTIIKTLLACWNNGYRQNGKKHNKPIGVKR